MKVTFSEGIDGLDTELLHGLTPSTTLTSRVFRSRFVPGVKGRSRWPPVSDWLESVDPGGNLKEKAYLTFWNVLQLAVLELVADAVGVRVAGTAVAEGVKVGVRVAGTVVAEGAAAVKDGAPVAGAVVFVGVTEAGGAAEAVIVATGVPETLISTKKGWLAFAPIPNKPPLAFINCQYPR